MTHKQHPLGTPFTPASTADEVLAGIDLTGRNAVVTGGHAGIGLEVTRALSKAGASIMVAARDPDRAARALVGFEDIEIGRLDLVDPRSIEAFATGWQEGGRPLHILVIRVFDKRRDALDLAYSDQPVSSFPPKTMRRIIREVSPALNPGAVRSPR